MPKPSNSRDVAGRSFDDGGTVDAVPIYSIAGTALPKQKADSTEVIADHGVRDQLPDATAAPPHTAAVAHLAHLRVIKIM